MVDVYRTVSAEDGQHVGVKRRVSRGCHSSCVALLRLFYRSDTQQSPGAFGCPRISSPSRRAMYVAPMFVRIGARHGLFATNGPFLAGMLARIGDATELILGVAGRPQVDLCPAWSRFGVVWCVVAGRIRGRPRPDFGPIRARSWVDSGVPPGWTRGSNRGRRSGPG